MLEDLAFETSTAKHAFRPPAVEGTSVQMPETGTHTAKSAEVLTTFGPLIFILWILRCFQDLVGLHLIKKEMRVSKIILNMHVSPSNTSICVSVSQELAILLTY